MNASPDTAPQGEPTRASQRCAPAPEPANGATDRSVASELLLGRLRQAQRMAGDALSHAERAVDWSFRQRERAVHARDAATGMLEWAAASALKPLHHRQPATPADASPPVHHPLVQPEPVGSDHDSRDVGPDSTT